MVFGMGHAAGLSDVPEARFISDIAAGFMSTMFMPGSSPRHVEPFAAWLLVGCALFDRVAQVAGAGVWIGLFGFCSCAVRGPQHRQGGA